MKTTEQVIGRIKEIQGGAPPPNESARAAGDSRRGGVGFGVTETPGRVSV